MWPAPNPAIGFLEAARAALAAGDFVRAVQAASEGLRLAPHDFDLAMCRGHAFFQLHDHPRAIADYSHAINLAPRDFEAYACRGVCLSELKQHAQALADLSHAIQLHPEAAGSWANRGRVYCDLKQYAAALADYRRAVELAPHRADYYYECGEACIYLEEYEHALGYMQRAIELDPHNPLYFTDRGAALYHLERYDQALADLNYAIQLNPEAIFAWYYRGQTHRKLGDKRRAFDDFSTLLARDPNWTTAYYERGKLFLESGRFAEAVADFSRAIELRPHQYLNFYLYRAEAYRGLGQTQLAARDIAYRDEAVRRQLAEVASRGVRVVITIVQAFGELYSTRYSSDAYAAVVLSFDPVLQQNPPALRDIAMNVARLKSTWPADPTLLALARVLTKEIGEDHRRLPIPAALTGGRAAFLADLWIYRPFLPLGRLDDSGLLYGLAEPGDAGRIQLLPQPAPEEIATAELVEEEA